MGLRTSLQGINLLIAREDKRRGIIIHEVGAEMGEITSVEEAPRSPRREDVH